MSPPCRGPSYTDWAIRTPEALCPPAGPHDLAPGGYRLESREVGEPGCGMRVFVFRDGRSDGGHNTKSHDGKVGRKDMVATESATCSSSPVSLNDLDSEDQGNGPWSSLCWVFPASVKLTAYRGKGDTKMCSLNYKLKYISVKRQIVNIFGFADHIFSVTIHLFLEHEGSQDIMYTNGHSCIPIKLY